MTDTARTLAQLQALFADNTTGDISPQDLRDFVMSARASAQHPTASAALNSSAIDTLASSTSYQPPTITSTVTLYDPSGMIQTGSSHVSAWYSVTFPARSWAIVPEGVWVLHVAVRWAASAVGARFAFCQPIDDYTATDPIQDAVAEYPSGEPIIPATAFSYNETRNHTHLVVPAGATRNVGVLLYQDSGSPLGVTAIDWVLLKVGN